LYGKFVFDSTISHIGFLLLALAINTEQSIDSFLFYLIQYTITNLNIFLIILAVTYSIYTPSPTQQKRKELQKMNELGKRIPKESEYNYDYYRESNSYRTTNNNTLISHTKLRQQIEIRYIYELKGLFFTNPLLSLSLCISLFSMAGIPPLIGFFSKQFVLYSALQNGYYFISLIAIIVSVISASYYLKIIKVLHTDHDYFEDKMLEGAVEENKAPNQSNVLLNEDMEFKKVRDFKEVKEFKEGAKVGGDCLTADIPIETITLKETPVAFAKLSLAHRSKAGEATEVGVDSRVGVSLSQSSEPILLDLDLNLEQSKTTLTNTHSFLISSLTLIILLFFIKPSLILNSTQLLSLSLFYI
jgi:NADH:ubiquinone oxidoreductase subunit 5 (subunit L)/multisubunit Na+/H+ antiporter MnhA subunit